MGVEQSVELGKLGKNESKAEVVHELVDSERSRIERNEDLIQITLAAVVPGVLAMMLFSFFLLPTLLPVLFVVAIAAAALMIAPALRMHRLHFRTWCVDSLTPKLMTAMVGMIYISVVSVFAFSMLSLYEGFSPEQPITFATIGMLLIMLIGVMGYSSRYKEGYLSTEKRFFPYPPEAVEERLAIRLEREGRRHRRNRGPKGTLFEIDEIGLHVHVRPLNQRHSEVLLRNISDKNREHLAKIKACIEGV